MDRYTRWPAALPLTDATASTVVNALLHHWIANYGIPDTITTDRGAQFESHLFQRISDLFGFRRIRTTSYHPEANGMIERFHRRLKEAIKATDNPSAWYDSLPIIMLALRNNPRRDTDCSPAELLYGEPLTMPCDLITEQKPQGCLDPSDFVDRLRQQMSRLQPILTRPTKRASYLPKDINSCSHVWIRIDRVRKPLEAPYSGPYKVLKRTEHYFTLKMKDKEDTVSVSRLKPAYLEDDFHTINQQPTCYEAAPNTPSTTTNKHPTHTNKNATTNKQTKVTFSIPQKQTRSGRKVHRPKRFIQTLNPE
ncbi:putative choline/ethanolamine kinase [Apostichopus japonicus]|uniref:Putative choline/ethanolamine kinase n=1 Tax=Stichopus japonicus TaxID=307972 RepID=A0A2G8JHK6_STIJA|nr:putative choline/ethanolamine kinase [Apostichopus japonicus]